MMVDASEKLLVNAFKPLRPSSGFFESLSPFSIFDFDFEFLWRGRDGGSEVRICCFEVIGVFLG
jgi:hypothetical protein